MSVWFGRDQGTGTDVWCVALLSPGIAVFAEGDDADSMLLLLTGSIALFSCATEQRPGEC